MRIRKEPLWLLSPPPAAAPFSAKVQPVSMGFAYSLQLRPPPAEAVFSAKVQFSKVGDQF
jgi:hypothetical protein